MKKSSLGSKISKLTQVNGMDLPYLVEQRNVRYPRLEFKNAMLLVILPKSCKDETSLLKRKMDWILKKHNEIQKALEKVRTQMKNDRDLLVFGDFFEFCGDGPLEIDFDGKWVKYRLGDRNQIRRLATMLKKQLLYEVESVAEEYCKKFGVGFNKIFIRRQRTRWASCSSKGNLSFNFWLICLPKELIRYVVCHEVLHLKEKRHDRVFWGIIGNEFDNYKQLKRSLFEYWVFVQEYSPSMFIGT